MSDDHDCAATLALRALEPLLDELFALLDEGPAARHRAAVLAARVYAAGHRDGIRHAVAQVAPEAEERGLRLHLADDVAA